MDSALRRDPNLWECQFELARLLEKAGRLEPALRCYDEILEAKDQGRLPESELTEKSLARYRAIRAELEGARKGGWLARLFGKG